MQTEYTTVLLLLDKLAYSQPLQAEFDVSELQGYERKH